MCPPFAPPGFFDLAVSHTPSLAWMWGLMFPLLLLIAFWVFHIRFRRVPSGQTRRTLAWLYCVQWGFFFGGLALEGLTTLRQDPITHWFDNLPATCYGGVQRIDFFDQLNGIEITLLGCSVLLFIVGVVISFITNKYARQAQTAWRQAIP